MLKLILAAVAALIATPGNAQTVSGCGTTAIARAEATDRAKLTTNADCFGKAKVVAAAAEAARRDRASTLPPAFVPTATATADLAGLAPVASGLDLAGLLQPSWGTGAIPGPEAPGVEGAFRFNCAPSHLSYDDEIVYPGQPGKAHLHQWFGNDRADAYSTYASLRTTGGSSCNSAGNRSAYDMPAMLHPSGKVVQPDYIFVYYKRAPAGSIYCRPPYAKACLPLPRGLRYVFGYNMQNPKKSDPAGGRWFNCDGPGAIAGHFATLAEAAKGCPAGARIGAMVVSPPCWDGKHLDSADHRSHMAFPAQDGYGHNACPSTHPYLLPFFEPGAWYTNDGTAADWRLSSDMAGMPGGASLHSDWFGAWEDGLLARWTANCIDKALSCSGGDLGDGHQLKTAAGYDYPHGRPLLDVPPR